MKKKSSLFYLSFMLLGILATNPSKPVEAAPTTILVNNTSVETDHFIQQNRTMVHSRFFEHAGVSVSWNDESKSVTLKRNGTLLSFKVGEREADFRRETGSWQRVELNVPTVNRNGRTYIPLRDAVEKLGFEISYNPETSQVSVGSPSPAPVTASRSSRGTHNEELYWLYQITEAEAGGESYEGKVAVASAILNRVKSEDFPNTVVDVIFQMDHKNGVDQYQYSPVESKRIYQVSPSEETKQAVHEAIKGTDPSEGATVFYNPDKTKNEWVLSRAVTVTIGNHVFAK